MKVVWNKKFKYMRKKSWQRKRENQYLRARFPSIVSRTLLCVTKEVNWHFLKRKNLLVEQKKFLNVRMGIVKVSTAQFNGINFHSVARKKSEIFSISNYFRARSTAPLAMIWLFRFELFVLRRRRK